MRFVVDWLKGIRMLMLPQVYGGNALRPGQMSAFLPTTFSNAYSSMKIFLFGWKFQWHLFPGADIGSDNGFAHRTLYDLSANNFLWIDL